MIPIKEWRFPPTDRVPEENWDIKQGPYHQDFHVNDTTNTSSMKLLGPSIATLGRVVRTCEGRPPHLIGHQFSKAFGTLAKSYLMEQNDSISGEIMNLTRGVRPVYICIHTHGNMRGWMGICLSNGRMMNYQAREAEAILPANQGNTTVASRITKERAEAHLQALSEYEGWVETRIADGVHISDNQYSHIYATAYSKISVQKIEPYQCYTSLLGIPVGNRPLSQMRASFIQKHQSMLATNTSGAAGASKATIVANAARVRAGAARS